ncbi:T9SS type A sorting domain-containing protein [Brumimicrobium aurantiacum]|nr:T9SS type A sorting domain-containing protein [Brumimicrobium aurantiacum]
MLINLVLSFRMRVSVQAKPLFLMVLFVTIFPPISQSQIYPSSCTGSEYAFNRFKIDATQIAVRKFFDQNLTYKDSIDVPDAHRDTILNALIAVYNLSIPESDSVDWLDIDIIYQRMGDVFISVDTSYFTMSEPSLDSLITKYNLSYFYHNPEVIVFNVADKYNQRALIKALEDVSGISDAAGRFTEMDGGNIEAEIHDDYVELVYTYAWHLCPFNCQYYRHWKFRVYYDCSVEFVEAYGDEYFPLDELGLNNNGIFEDISLFPNPANDKLNISLNNYTNSMKLEIIDLTGKKVKTLNYSSQGNVEFKMSIDISNLRNGLYFCKFTSDGKQVTHKFIKQ